MLVSATRRFGRLSAIADLGLWQDSGGNEQLTCRLDADRGQRLLSSLAQDGKRPKALISHLKKWTFRNVDSEWRSAAGVKSTQLSLYAAVCYPTRTALGSALTTLSGADAATTTHIVSSPRRYAAASLWFPSFRYPLIGAT